MLFIKKKTFLLFTFYIFIIIVFVLLKDKKNKKYIHKDRKENTKLENENNINHFLSKKNEKALEYCYSTPFNKKLKIIHLIITRFILEFWSLNNFKNKIYTQKYIKNGFRVLKKYLLPSLENQSCKEFIWILLLGNKANITYIESLLDFNNSFDYKLVYIKSFNKYIKNISKGSDILITTRIDYDDRIYYDAVNDVRKAININKPILLYGYNRGMVYYEIEDKYYYFYNNFNNNGVMSVFCSLIIVLNKVNDTYNIFNLGGHPRIKLNLLKSYNSFGIKELNYDPAIFDSGDVKFVWVRQIYSGMNYTFDVKKKYIKYNFNLSLFYGK